MRERVNEDIRVIFPDSYPKPLQASPKPPKRLYIRGTFSTDPDQKYLCVIGSRKWTPYGRDVVDKFISGLSGYPITIVSGLAEGIDSMAHEAALRAGLHCVGCPGTGLAWTQCGNYSRLNLVKRILQTGGAVISLWHPDHPGARWTYPVRNKLMAALSDAVLIVEGKETSGTMGTADAVSDLNRDIFVVPGSIYADQSAGPHFLLRTEKTAKIVTAPEDVIAHLGFEVTKSTLLKSRAFENMDTDSKQILTILHRGGMSVDELIYMVGKSPVELQVKLSELELKGHIRIDAGMLKLV